MNDKLLIKQGYIESSKYRTKVIKTCGYEVKTPTKIANDCEISPKHISKTLRELKNIKCMECINEEAKKGRLYRLTEDGQKVYENMR